MFDHAGLRQKIAKYAAAAIYGDDLVYIGAGTTTLMMIPYINAPGAEAIGSGLGKA